MITLKRKIGNAMIEVQAENFKGICNNDDLLGRIPEKCGLCKSADLHFYHKTPKGFDYYGIRCKACGAEQSFHTKQADGSFFVKWDDKFEKYGGSEKQGADDFDDDIPI